MTPQDQPRAGEAELREAAQEAANYIRGDSIMAFSCPVGDQIADRIEAAISASTAQAGSSSVICSPGLAAMRQHAREVPGRDVSLGKAAWDRIAAAAVEQAAIAAAPGVEGEYKRMVREVDTATDAQMNAPRTPDAGGVTREEIEQIIRGETYATITERVGGIGIAADAILARLHGQKEG